MEPTKPKVKRSSISSFKRWPPVSIRKSPSQCALRDWFVSLIDQEKVPNPTTGHRCWWFRYDTEKPKVYCCLIFEGIWLFSNGHLWYRVLVVWNFCFHKIEYRQPARTDQPTAGPAKSLLTGFPRRLSAQQQRHKERVFFRLKNIFS